MFGDTHEGCDQGNFQMDSEAVIEGVWSYIWKY